MYKATELIAKVFEDREVKYTTEETEKYSAVVVRFSTENVSNVEVRFFSTDDDNDVMIRVYDIICVSDGGAPKMLETINELNGKYRFAKFTLDKNGKVDLEFDVPRCTENIGSVCAEMCIRVAKIINEAYSNLAQTKFGWSN